MSGYNGKLKDGREIYVPHWPASVSLENLAKAGQCIGTSALIQISELNTPAVIIALADAKDSAATVGLIKHFVCSMRIEGKKIDASEFDELFSGNLGDIPELFATVVHAQYFDFFASGLAKAPSPSN